jgi:hypothetical protein
MASKKKSTDLPVGRAPRSKYETRPWLVSFRPAWAYSTITSILRSNME